MPPSCSPQVGFPHEEHVAPKLSFCPKPHSCATGTLCHGAGAGSTCLQGWEGGKGGEGVLLLSRRQHSPWMPLTVCYCYHLTAFGETIFVIQPCLSQPVAQPSVGFHGKLPSKTRRKGVTAGVTQPQLEASADEAEKGGTLPTSLVPIGQRGPGTPPDVSCSSLVPKSQHTAGRSQAQGRCIV